VKARLILIGALLLAGCATSGPEAGKVVSQDRFEQLIVPGRTTKAELLAAFGETRTVVFDSGYEAWLYESPAPGGRHTELVLLLGPDGIVRKMRRRPPYPSDPPPR
jgi:PBP1b-binding outer membrane lipoprotein LpoB